MNANGCDPLIEIAEKVAFCFSERGYAFVEDDKVEALADTLGSFLKTAGIPVHAVADDTFPDSW
ncbi:hypothetical protein EV385_3574 [Krasilnikovia cinnamomea]|uniref:Uncharacterized protein n=1 Tax=Krasilnikovia cinnamomea TaxID=349313 RepID=A0A4Q7ZM89_9ACTN|nr:hypothetical protein [Krasilnikovia cinnamomea]RZU51741.1 hypothetical protein EV385_3574 [Krasilnikovia cinnamomea]